MPGILQLCTGGSGPYVSYVDESSFGEVDSAGWAMAVRGLGLAGRSAEHMLVG